MPNYESNETTAEDLDRLRRSNTCRECGGQLDIFYDFDRHKSFLACRDWHRNHHTGIMREVSRYEKGGLRELTIEARREILKKEFGTEMTTTQLAKYQGGGALTKEGAMEVLKLVYPKVPEVEIIRTALLCRDFGLHPLMKEVYILGFKNKAGGTDYATVIGINASRKMASDKKGSYSFADDTPRAATQEEIVKQYGTNSEEARDNLVSICKLKGERGNEAIGFGLWPKAKEPYGTDKGNTKRNMSNIRAERQATDRLPGEAIPLRGLDVIDEAVGEAMVASGRIVEIDGRPVDRKTGEVLEGAPAAATPVQNDSHWCDEHDCAFEKKQRGSAVWYAHKDPDGKWCNEAKANGSTKPKPELPEEPEEPPPPSSPIDLEWLKEQLNILQGKKLEAWSNANIISYLKAITGKDAKKVSEAVSYLDVEQAELFVQKVQEVVEMA